LFGKQGVLVASLFFLSFGFSFCLTLRKIQFPNLKIHGMNERVHQWRGIQNSLESEKNGTSQQLKDS